MLARLDVVTSAPLQPARDLVAVGRRFVNDLPPLLQDGALYLLAAVFAGLVALHAEASDYRLWGELVAPAYLVGGIGCLAVNRVLQRRLPRRLSPQRVVSSARRVAVLFLLVTAVALPLLTELTWRADGHPGANAQPEVAVIEQAGRRAWSGRDPYPPAPTTVGVPPHDDSSSTDANSFFPYLPGMVPFGFVTGDPGPPELRDARIALAGFTLLVAAAVLAAPSAALGRRGRVLQVLVVLPTGSLPLVTGGDDLPVLALMLWGLVLAQRRRPVLAGLVLGLDATLKLTAWPVLVLLMLVIRDRDGERATGRYAAAAGLVAIPVTLLGLAADPAAFVLNVVRFPLGLTRVKSPAASPLLGQVLVTVLPHEKRVVTAGLLLVGLVIVAVALRRHAPRTPGQVARFTCFALLLATVLAPATRFGYLIYPANLLAWGYLLDGMSLGRRVLADQPASSISYSDNESVLVGAC